MRTLTRLAVILALGAGAVQAEPMQEPTDPVARRELKCQLRRVGVERLVKVFTHEGDAVSATDALRLLDVQNSVTLTGKITPAQVGVVVEVLNGRANELVICRALGTVSRPLAGKMLSAADKARLNPAVSKHLAHASPLVRRIALQIITGFGNPADFPAVAALAKDPDPLVRSTAQGAVAVFRQAGLAN